LFYLFFIFNVVVNPDEAVEKVNLWAKEKTNGLIPQGVRDQHFDAAKTNVYDFHLLMAAQLRFPS
jgi:serine protease inhibitor